MEMTLGPTYSEKGSISAVNRPIAIKTSAQLSQRPALGANKLRAILSIDGILQAHLHKLLAILDVMSYRV
jgi:hypothetical protein